MVDNVYYDFDADAAADHEDVDTDDYDDNNEYSGFD